MINISEFIARAKEVPWLDQGRDWSGWNCWGLLAVAYRELKGVDLPDFNHLGSLRYREAEPEFSAFRESFVEIRPGREGPLDIVLFRGEPCHVGLVIKRGLMLHVEPGLATFIEPYDQGAWPGRLLGIYRHA